MLKSELCGLQQGADVVYTSVFVILPAPHL